jgi:hypothetical protein
VKILFTFILIFFFFSNSQAQDSTKTIIDKNDSLKVTHHASINELKEILFDNSLADPFSAHINKEVSKVYLNISIPESNLNTLPERDINSFDNAKKNLLGAIRMQPKFLPANELGFLGKVFIYANAAAFGYALYKHIEKYKDDY